MFKKSSRKIGPTSDVSEYLKTCFFTSNLDLDALSEACYNNSRQIDLDLNSGKLAYGDIKPTENCFGWKYFESAFILAIIQIVLAFVGVCIAAYILRTVMKLKPMKMLRDLQEAHQGAELSENQNVAKNDDTPISD